MRMERLRAARRGWLAELPPVPVSARQAEWSAVSSADDLYVRPTDEIVDILLRAASEARSVDLHDLAGRCGTADEARWVQTWPGEHYRLLAALARTVQPKVAVEVGTFRGLGALALLAGMPADGKVITYDVVPWQEFDPVVLRDGDFGDRLEQRIGDLTEKTFLGREIDTLRVADLIFVDGPKDGVFEQTFCDQVISRLTDRPRLVVFDDICRLNMLQLWRDLPFAKLDATSLGHWSGTGMILTS